MNVSLTPELEKFVNDMVKSGMYITASEVVRDALRDLKDVEAIRQKRLEDLKAEIKLGEESGEKEGWISEDELRKHMAEVRASFIASGEANNDA